MLNWEDAAATGPAENVRYGSKADTRRISERTAGIEGGRPESDGPLTARSSRAALRPDCAIQTVSNRACKPSFVHAARVVPDAAVNVRWSNLAGRRLFSRDAEKRMLRGMVSQPFGCDTAPDLAERRRSALGSEFGHFQKRTFAERAKPGIPAAEPNEAERCLALPSRLRPARDDRS